MAVPFHALYHASKWAVEGYSLAQRRELASSGIDVVVVEPGPFTTSLFPTMRQPEDTEDRAATYPAAAHQAFQQMGAGFGEETVLRGFLFERLGKLLGRGAGATIAIVLLTSAWFGLIHYPGQGFAGAEQAVITGLVFGSIFAITGRIWLPIFAHAAFDLTAVFIIYRNLESYVAHLVFRVAMRPPGYNATRR